MSKPLPDLRRRQRALQKTMDRYGKREFLLGSADCVQLARFHLKNMGVKKLPVPQKYTTEVGARLALKRLGFKTLEELFDNLLVRIAPAAMLPGDIALLPSQPEEPASDIGTVAISLGRKLLAWHPDHAPLAVIEVTQIDAAWRA